VALFLWSYIEILITCFINSDVAIEEGAALFLWIYTEIFIACFFNSGVARGRERNFFVEL